MIAAEKDKRTVQPFIGRIDEGASAESASSDFSPALQQALSGDAVVLSCIGGNAHNALGLLRYSPPLDFVLSEKPDLPLDPEAEILPERAVRATLENRTKHQLNLLRSVAAAAAGPVFHAESPPPAPDNEAFRVDLARRSPLPAASPYLRYKMWRLHSSIVRLACKAAGVRFIERPEKTVDEEGFLRPEFFINATHATSAYARLMWHKLDKLL